MKLFHDEKIDAAITRLSDRMFRWFPYKDSFVVVALIWMILNGCLAFALGSLVPSVDDSDLLDTGLRLLGLVSNASISIVTLTFSLTVLSVQIASQNYSPRLLDDFLKQQESKRVISVNLGAYSYCFTLSYFLCNSNQVPRVAVHILTLQMALVLLSFINFIQFFLNGFRLEKILDQAVASSLRAAYTVAAQYNICDDDEDDVIELPEVPRNAYKVLAVESGYIRDYTFDDISSLADKMDITIRYCFNIGEFVNRGTVLCYVWDANTCNRDLSLDARVLKFASKNNEQLKAQSTEDPESTEFIVQELLLGLADKGVKRSKKRRGELDVTLGIQQLSDIAVRALSAAINDPQTAIQCMDSLSNLLSTLATMDLGLPIARDKGGHIRVCAPRRSFTYLLSMLDSIRKYGGSDLGVCRRGLRLFGDIGVICARSGRVDRVPSVLAQIEQWMVVSRHNFLPNSPELKSLEARYDHILRAIAECGTMTIKEEGGVKNFEDFESTYFHSHQDEEQPPDKASKRKSKEMDRRKIMHFLKRVDYSESKRDVACKERSIRFVPGRRGSISSGFRGGSQLSLFRGGSNLSGFVGGSSLTGFRGGSSLALAGFKGGSTLSVAIADDESFAEDDLSQLYEDRDDVLDETIASAGPLDPVTEEELNEEN